MLTYEPDELRCLVSLDGVGPPVPHTLQTLTLNRSRQTEVVSRARAFVKNVFYARCFLDQRSHQNGYL